MQYTQEAPNEQTKPKRNSKEVHRQHTQEDPNEQTKPKRDSKEHPQPT